MTLLNGLAGCIYCGETFDLGHHYDFHMALCRVKKRTYSKMEPKLKRQLVANMENYIRTYIPTAFIGYGETI